MKARVYGIARVVFAESASLERRATYQLLEVLFLLNEIIITNTLIHRLERGREGGREGRKRGDEGKER